MLFSISDPEELSNALQKNLNFSKEEVSPLTKISYDSDYGSISTKAIKNILPYMKQGLRYDEACKKYSEEYNNKNYNHSEKEIKKLDRVRIIKQNSLRSPVVEQITIQVSNIVNEIIEKYGKPDKVNIELARELMKSAKEKKGIEEKVNKILNFLMS